jgi:hypothetical protein
MAILKNYSWLNDDGLPIYFGIDEARLAVVTEYETDGAERVIDIMIPDASLFNATDEYLLSDKFNLPIGCIITNVKTKANSTAFASSGSGVISIGTVESDFATNSDIDSIVALASVAELNAGGDGNSGTGVSSPGDGVLVQAGVSTKILYLTLSVDTAVFQTGAGGFEISYIIPKTQTDTLVYSK